MVFWLSRPESPLDPICICYVLHVASRSWLDGRLIILTNFCTVFFCCSISCDEYLTIVVCVHIISYMSDLSRELPFTVHIADDKAPDKRY